MSGTRPDMSALTCSRVECPARRSPSRAGSSARPTSVTCSPGLSNYAGLIQPRALLLENVRGLSLPRFAAYRQHVLDRLGERATPPTGGCCRLRLWRPAAPAPVRARRDAAGRLRVLHWPDPPRHPHVGETLLDLMANNGWPGAAAWAARRMTSRRPSSAGRRSTAAPTSGRPAPSGPGANLRWTRLAWPTPRLGGRPGDLLPKLTCEMVARIQGWDGREYRWEFTGRKTSNYRQIGNAFPPPVARASGPDPARPGP